MSDRYNVYHAKDLFLVKCGKKIRLYCDWTSDNDFLKRELVSEYTKIILKKRLEQSDNLLFLSTTDSIGSELVDFELKYFASLKKPIYYIQSEGVNDSRLLTYIKFKYVTVS